MTGWVKIHRKIISNPLWSSEPFDKARAWIDLIILANYEAGFIMVRGIKVDIKRGQVGWSEPRLAERWRWSRSKVRGFLKLLENEQQIRIEKNNVNQVITIINYTEYQHEKTADRTTEGQQTGQQKDPNKEVDKLNKKNKTNVELFNDAKTEFSLPDGYEQKFLLWIEYKTQRNEFYVPIEMQGFIKQSLEDYPRLPEFVSAIENSISKGYKGIFPKNQKNGSNKSEEIPKSYEHWKHQKPGQRI